ncbi:sensor histidine kinase [Agrilactobacillus fermenti]|uniref:sensor histidine kinase n=1 Tax=Agrilactobacillus fermenti TaxID=2586909 RepID=UPI001E615886|nr:sensor histidine kinase [Agrilactobacillus fermenti]MCD2255682.1 sensor histidine kinase [Agrilactobacillus fermenti]
MLEMSNWVMENFTRASDAMFIFQDDQVLLMNDLAKDLIDQSQIDLDYLKAIVLTYIKRDHSESDDCFGCAIKGQLSNITIPVTLNKDSDTPLSFSLVYQQLSETQNVYTITLKSLVAKQRVDQLAMQKSLIQYINRAHEDERKHISEDLHDSIAQGIFTAIMGIGRLVSEQATTSKAEFANQGELIQNQLREVLNEVKGMALDLRPSALDDLGLVPALKTLIQRLQENTGIKITFINRLQAITVPNDIAIVLYRIAQEAMSNAIKHADTDEITLLLLAHDKRVSLEVIDTGTGFDTQKMTQPNGRSLGLLNMNERVKALNGVFTIDSKVGEGTSVKVEFPVRSAHLEA